MKPTARVLEIFESEEDRSCEHLTVTERAQLAELYGWKKTESVRAWIATAPTTSTSSTIDYEEAILRSQGF